MDRVLGKMTYTTQLTLLDGVGHGREYGSEENHQEGEAMHLG